MEEYLPSSSWMNETMREASQYLYQLLRAGLLKEPVEKNERINWDDVFYLAQHNSVSGLAYYGILESGITLPQKINELWKKELIKIITRQTQIDIDREILAEKMNQHNIDYLYIKGIVLQSLYPKPGMRQMSDNDILYRYDNDNERGLKSKSQIQLKKVMRDLGAKEISDDGIVDVYLIGQSSLFEMHRDFLSPDHPLYEYFHSIWAKAFTEEGEHKYSLSWEDQYILIVAHSFKHYIAAGCGPREIIDLWQFRRMLFNEINWAYISKELDNLNLKEYESMLVEIGNKLFDKNTITIKDAELLNRFMSNGTYGSKQNEIKNELKKIDSNNTAKYNIKYEYIKKRLFPESKYLQTHFPFFSRHRSLIIFLTLYRLSKAFFAKPRNILNEIKFLKKANLTDKSDKK